MTARRIAAAAALAAAALLLPGCVLIPFLPGVDTGREETVTTHTDEEVASELEPFYKQSLTWTSLGGDIDHTEITVPLDWDDPTGATIQIAVARHRASNPIGSLLLNPGGPGGSGYEFVEYSAGFVVTPAVLSRYDLIGFDPRGVNNSSPVVCYTDPADQDELLYGTFDAPYGSDGWIDELEERESAWSAACLENTGPLLGHIDAGSVARDMDVIRAVLGDESLSYLGYSYGTYLGATYAELFPEKVGRMVLDGAVDPRVGDLDALAAQAAGFESAYRAFLEYCLAESDCPFDGSVPNALRQTADLLASVDGAGLTSSDGRVLDSATAGTGLIYNLYAEFLWSSLVGMLNDLEQGDADSTFDSADSYNGREFGTYPENGSDIYTAVTCVEGSLGTDGIDPLEGLAIIEEAAPTLGRYIALDDYVVLDVVCSDWPTPVAEVPTEFDADGAPPILVVGTTNDPATPYAQAVSLARQLSSGVLVTYEGEGHTIYAQGVSCVDDTVDAYLLEGTVPASDPMC
jgi:pimeloyl-ACP methyl ester carboxylesterase